MRSTFSALVLLALISTTVVLAATDTAMLITVSFLPNGSATFDDIQVTKAGVDQMSSASLRDSIQLVIDGKSIFRAQVPVTYRMLDAPKLLPVFSSTHRFPYPGNKGMLQVIHENKTMAEFDLKQLCVKDGWCRGFENGLTCPEDCDIRYADGICLPYDDGGCDPDCREGLDQDCAPKAPLPQESRALPFLLLAIVLLGLTVFFWWRQRK